MNIPDLWSLVTGVVGIVSFLITLPPKYAKWKKYTLPIACFLGGFTFGRLSSEFSQSVYAVFQDPYLAVVFIIILVILVVATWFLSVLNKQNESWLAYSLFIMIVLVGIPGVFSVYSQIYKINPAIPTQDYLELAKVKESKGDLGNAINYYQKYLNKVDNEHSKKEVEQKIFKLRSRQINELN